MPCAIPFAVCTISGTRQTCPLPCVLRTSTRQKIGTRQTCPLPCSLRISTRRRFGTRQTSPFAVCQGTKHTTKTRHTAKVGSLPCAITTAHGKDSNFVVCHVGSAHGKACATSPFLSPAFFAVGQDLHTAKLCRVPDILHTVKDWHTANMSFVVFPQNQHTAKIWHTANVTLCRVPGNKAHDED